jgi:hypothetical protein
MRFWDPLNTAYKTKYLEFTYMVTIGLLLASVVFTPVFITHHLLLIKKYVIQEDAVEAVLISFLLLIAFLLSHVYKKQLKKYCQEACRLSRGNSDLAGRLTEAFKYIGGVNVQIQEMRSIFCGLKRYPATENEFRSDLALFARKVLAIVNTDWVLIRIIGQPDLRTIKEHVERRKNSNLIIKGISNKAVAANRVIDGYSFVASRHDDSMITVVFVFPKNSLDEEERILVAAITNQIEMLYLIFVSRQPYAIYFNRKPIMRNSDQINAVKQKTSR